MMGKQGAGGLVGSLPPEGALRGACDPNPAAGAGSAGRIHVCITMRIFFEAVEPQLRLL
jgi:hypothetical protein